MSDADMRHVAELAYTDMQAGCISEADCVDWLMAFAESARADERARCAKVCRDRAEERFKKFSRNSYGGTHYVGSFSGQYENWDEEDRACAEAIEQLPANSSQAANQKESK